MIILCGAVSALADWDTLVFEDTVKPHGQERGDTERNADLLACGSTSNFEIDTSKIPAAVRFMRRHGWHLYESAAHENLDRSGYGRDLLQRILYGHSERTMYARRSLGLRLAPPGPLLERWPNAHKNSRLTHRQTAFRADVRALRRLTVARPTCHNFSGSKRCQAPPPITPPAISGPTKSSSSS